MKTASQTIGIPSERHGTTYTGGCAAEQNNTQWLTIKFYKTWMLTIVFSELSDTEYYMSDITLSGRLDTDLFPDIIAPGNYNTCGSYFASILHSSLQYREIKIKKSQMF